VRSQYEELLKAWRAEAAGEEIQRIDEDFYEKLSQYVRHLLDELNLLDEESISGRLVKKELLNAQKMVEDLIRRRFDKILRHVESNQPVVQAALTPLEREVSSSMSRAYENHRFILERVIQGASLQMTNPSSQNVLVRILKDIPSIVGIDMKTYGPFKNEDVTTLPKENAEALVRRGLAVKIEA